jgi:primosomal protein DnaI
MDPIQSSLKKWIQGNEDFQENYRKIRQEVLQDPEIKEFLSRHPEVGKKQIGKHLIKLYEYKAQSKQCSRCASLGTCINMLPGYSPVLETAGGEIKLAYEKCRNQLAHEKQQEQQKLIQSLYMPKEILHADFDQLDVAGENAIQRGEAIREANQFLIRAQSDLPAQGLFFTGPFGVGKTYFLGAIANRLRDFNISSMLIYMPELVREMKTSIQDNTIGDKIDFFKKADVLMLDDIGAEAQSPWFRDEVLGSILQYRMMERLPVFFTSNYTLEQLKGQLAITSKGGIEEVKAGRIIERIKQVSKEITLSGENRRDNPPLR